MVETALVEHRLAHRMRLRIASKRGDTGYFEQLVAGLARFAEAREVIANPATGSVLLHLDGSPDRVLERAREEGLFKMENAGAAPRRQHRDSADPENGPAPVPSPVTAGLLALSLLQLLRGEAMGPAAEGLWNARLAAGELNRPWLAVPFALAGIYQLANGRVLGSAASLLVYALVLQQNQGRRASHEAEPGETVAKA